MVRGAARRLACGVPVQALGRRAGAGQLDAAVRARALEIADSGGPFLPVWADGTATTEGLPDCEVSPGSIRNVARTWTLDRPNPPSSRGGCSGRPSSSHLPPPLYPAPGVYRHAGPPPPSSVPQTQPATRSSPNRAGRGGPHGNFPRGSWPSSTSHMVGGGMDAALPLLFLYGEARAGGGRGRLRYPTRRPVSTYPITGRLGRVSTHGGGQDKGAKA